MKIALVSPYDFVFPGGVCHHIVNLEHYLTRMGHQVKVVAPASHTVTSFGDRFIPVGKPRPVPASGSIVRLTISPWIGSRIKAILTEEKFDMIHLHEPLMPMICTTVLRLSPTATVGTFHAVGGQPGYDFGWPLTTIWLKRWFRRLNGRIAVSQSAMEFAGRYFPAPYEIIPNGVDLERFSPEVAPINEYRDGKLNILFVGRLEKRKGVNYLLDAYRQVKRQIPDSRLIIVGPGTMLRRQYERRVRRWHLPDVVFAGHVAYDDLPRYYQTADVFCSPATRSESFGIVLLEAMAMGKPIVASNLEGYAGVVTHGAEGLLVPPRNSSKLAQALITVMTDKSLQREMGARGRLKAQDYSWARVAQQVYNYYVQVLKGKVPELEAMSARG